MRVLGSRPSPSTAPVPPSTSWIISRNRRTEVFCSGVEYQRSKTAMSQSA
jgi:hypothetical protein